MGEECHLASHGRGGTCVAWRPDGKVLASAGYDGIVRLYDPDKDKGEPRLIYLNKPKERTHLRKVFSISFWKGDALLLTYGLGSRPSFPDPEVLSFEGKERKPILRPLRVNPKVPGDTNDWMQGGAVSRDGRLLATTGTNNHEVLVWDTRDRKLYQLGGRGKGVWAVGWHRRGDAIAWWTSPFPRRGDDPNLAAFSLVQADRLSPPIDRSDYRPASPGKLTAELSVKSPWELVVYENKKPLRSLTTPGKRTIHSFAVSSTAPERVAVGTENWIEVFDARTGKHLLRLIGHRCDVRALEFSPRNPDLLLSGSADQTVRVWNLAESLKERFSGIGVYTTFLASGERVDRFEKNGSAWKDGRLQAGDVIEGVAEKGGPFVKLASLKQFQRGGLIRGPEGTVVRLLVRKPGKKDPVVYEIKRQPVEADTNLVEPLLTLFAAGPEWVAYTERGYYACSANGERLMGWQIDQGVGELGKFYPAEAFRPTLFRPDVIRLLVKKGNVEKALEAANQQSGRKGQLVRVREVLPPKVRLVKPAPSADGPVKVGATVTVEAEVLGVRKKEGLEVSLWLDHALVTGSGTRVDPKPLRPTTSVKGGVLRAIWTGVKLTDGSHVIQGRVVNEQGSTGSSDNVRLQKGAPVGKRTLYLLAIGASYRAESGFHDLLSSKNDAIHLAEILKRQQGKVFDKVVSKLLTGKEATRAKILDELKQVQKEAQTNDVVIFSFSGHGAEENGLFYLVPHDGKKKKLSDTGIHIAQVKEYLWHTKGTRICLLDACKSGMTNAVRLTSVVENMTKKTGMVVFCGCRDKENCLDKAPQEPPRLSLFTYALIQTLRGKVPRHGEGPISLNEILFHVQEIVIRERRLFKDKKKQTPLYGHDADLPLTDIKLAVPEPKKS
jgi:hypothetical protein